MFIKKLIILLYLVFLGINFVNADSISILNGIWIQKRSYDWIINNPGDRVLNNLTILEDRFQISWNKKTEEGRIQFGMDQNSIKSIEEINNVVKIIYGYWKKEIFFKSFQKILFR